MCKISDGCRVAITRLQLLLLSNLIPPEVYLLLFSLLYIVWNTQVFSSQSPRNMAAWLPNSRSRLTSTRRGTAWRLHVDYFAIKYGFIKISYQNHILFLYLRVAVFVIEERTSILWGCRSLVSVGIAPAPAPVRTSWMHVVRASPPSSP